MSRAREVSKVFSSDTSLVTISELNSALQNVTVDLSGYATINQLSASVGNINMSSAIVTASAAAVAELNNRIYINSASPTGGSNGQIWIDPTTASAPILSVLASSSWKQPSLGRFSATGGIITEANGYRIHTFTSTSAFISNGTKSVEYLIVAGGGGGGFGSGGGGGGAGGLLSGATSVSSGSYTITIGSGGSGGIDSSATNSTAGTLSSFNAISTTGGGSGGSENGVAGSSGGSGGGACYNSAIGVGVSGQGYNGGPGYASSPHYKGGGGGGAGGIGGSGSTGSGGAGGIGVQSSITGSPIYYSGGGGGEAQGGGSAGAGGQGGGGTGGIANTTPATNGTVNTGGGGGGGTNSYSGHAGVGGNGGSGIVIIRYLI
jgi:hypothetical protein